MLALRVLDLPFIPFGAFTLAVIPGGGPLLRGHELDAMHFMLLAQLGRRRAWHIRAFGAWRWAGFGTRSLRRAGTCRWRCAAWRRDLAGCRVRLDSLAGSQHQGCCAHHRERAETGSG